MWKRLNSNQMCEQCSYKEVSYREVLMYIYIYIYIYIYMNECMMSVYRLTTYYVYHTYIED